jgi:hypothetical protein
VNNLDSGEEYGDLTGDESGEANLAGEDDEDDDEHTVVRDQCRHV